jgi:hypothetical protein
MTRLAISSILWLGACASAVPVHEGTDTVDAAVGRDAAIAIDAPVGDPPPSTMTLTQSSSSAITPASSVACIQAGSARETSYYRVFRIADHAITTPFTPQQVTFGVQQVAGTHAVQVKLHTLVGALTVDHLTPIASTAVAVDASKGGQLLSTAISSFSIPADATLVAEILVADGPGTGRQFLLGANAAAETQPGYIRSPACGTPNPSTLASIGFPDAHIVLTVTGTR